MVNINEQMQKTQSEIEDSGYKVESKSFQEKPEAVFNISFYDKKHIAKYSFIEKINDDDEAYIKIDCNFLSGIDEDFTKIIEGKKGAINISNAGKQKYCRIEYKTRLENNAMDGSNVKDMLGEVEGSIYNVKYRKYFAL